MTASRASRDPADRLVRQLQGSLKLPGVSAGFIQLRIALLRAQYALAAQLPTGAPGAVAGAAGRASFTPADGGLMAGLLQALGRTLQAQNLFNDQLRQVLQRAEAEPSALAGLAGRAASSDRAEDLEDLCAFWGPPAASLLFLGRALAAPFFEARAPARAPETSGSPAGRCPACGSLPANALLVGEAGSRHLCCPLCASQWEFSRTACPFCRGNASLQTLRVASEPLCWIESCGLCRGYVKTFDRRKASAGEEYSVLVATCATLHLDLLAEENGLRPGLPYAAMR